MTIEDAITMFKAIELGKSPTIGFNLHKSIRQATEQRWPLKYDLPNGSFSEFLEELRDSPPASGDL